MFAICLTACTVIIFFLCNFSIVLFFTPTIVMLWRDFSNCFVFKFDEYYLFYYFLVFKTGWCVFELLIFSTWFTILRFAVMVWIVFANTYKYQYLTNSFLVMCRPLKFGGKAVKELIIFQLKTYTVRIVHFSFWIVSMLSITEAQRAGPTRLTRRRSQWPL